MEGQLFESHILAISGANAVNSPSVPALGLFSQPIDGQPLPSLNLDALGDIGPPNDEDSLGLPLGTLAPGAKWYVTALHWSIYASCRGRFVAGAATGQRPPPAIFEIPDLGRVLGQELRTPPVLTPLTRSFLPLRLQGHIVRAP